VNKSAKEVKPPTPGEMEKKKNTGTLPLLLIPIVVPGIAGNRTFFHVVDWWHRNPDPIVGLQMASIEAEGFYAGGGAQGEGVYSYRNENQAAQLAQKQGRPYAKFKVNPETPVDVAYVQNNEGVSQRYLKQRMMY